VRDSIANEARQELFRRPLLLLLGGVVHILKPHDGGGQIAWS
jgi:hypothetical protein